MQALSSLGVTYPGLQSFSVKGNNKRLHSALEIPGVEEGTTSLLIHSALSSSPASLQILILIIFIIMRLIMIITIMINTMPTIFSVAAGWTAQHLLKGQSERDRSVAQGKLAALLKSAVDKISASKHAWPFTQKVDPRSAPDYASIIKTPIDLIVIQERLRAGDYYRTKDMLCADLFLMVRLKLSLSVHCDYDHDHRDDSGDDDDGDENVDGEVDGEHDDGEESKDDDHV